MLFRKTASWLPSRVESFFKKYLQTKEAAFGILLITSITISLIAQDIGLHFVIGTFFSGLVVFKEMIANRISTGSMEQFLQSRLDFSRRSSLQLLE